MSAALKLEPRPPKWSVEDYIEAEQGSEIRHEYVGGRIYAKEGGSEDHNFISGNIAVALRSHVRAKPCKVFIHGMRAHVSLGVPLFYYPDVMVVCDPSDDDHYYKTKPRIVVEVVSESTRGIDTREKLITFIQLPSLEEYVLVEQDSMSVTVHRRSKEWMPEVLTGTDALLDLSSIGFSMPLSQIYEGVF